MIHVVGGVFALEEEQEESGEATFFRPNQVLLPNARSGLYILLKHLRPPRVWMPAFLCDSMFHPVIEHGSDLRFYPIGEDLSLSSRDWIDAVRAGDLVVLVDYFGFVLHLDVAGSLKDRGAWILEDASQALLTDTAGALGDFVLHSPRKFAGIPDGGILEFKNAPSPCLDLQPPPSEWWAMEYAACLQRRQFDHCGGSRGWLTLHQQAERSHPIGAYAMSELSQRIARGLRWTDIARKRIDNYNVLADRLGHLALFPQLPAGTVPFGFSIRVRHRDAVRAALFEKENYPSLLWPIAGSVPDEFAASHLLSAQIMTLHCDQRYDADDMLRTAEIILNKA